MLYLSEINRLYFKVNFSGILFLFLIMSKKVGFGYIYDNSGILILFRFGF